MERSKKKNKKSLSKTIIPPVAVLAFTRHGSCEHSDDGRQDSRHAMQIVDATCVVNLYLGFQPRLMSRKLHQGGLQRQSTTHVRVVGGWVVGAVVSMELKRANSYFSNTTLTNTLSKSAMSMSLMTMTTTITTTTTRFTPVGLFPT